MPTQGALIYASDYTDIRKQVSRILGDKITEYPTDAERAKFGYGQSVLSDTQTITREVTDIDNDHLNTLRVDVNKIATHCGVEFNPVITGLPIIQEGDIVDNAHLEAYDAAITLLNTNRFELAESQSSLEDLLNEQGQPITDVRTTPWGNNNTYSDANIRHAFTVDFGTAERARYFFNAGGQIRFSASRILGLNSYQDQVWTNLLNQMGTIIFKHNSCYGEVGTNTSIGFYQLTNAPQLVFTKEGSAVNVYATQYLSNDYTIRAWCNVNDNQYGGARYLYFTVEFNDDHYNNPGSPISADQVTGTLTSTVKIKRASGDNVSVLAPIAYNTTNLSS